MAPLYLTHTTVRFCTPSPQRAEQLPHAYVRQVGQENVLQLATVEGLGPVHMLSETVALVSVVTQRTGLVCVPVPQVAEQRVQPSLTQIVGQA